MTPVEAEILALLKPVPLYAPVEGAPFQPGDQVVIAVPGAGVHPDVHVEDHIGKGGRVEYLEYECGSGQTFPGDPMIGVVLEDGTREEFWKDEIALATGASRGEGKERAAGLCPAGS